MSLAQLSPLVIFPEDVFSDLYDKDEFQIWFRLHQIYIRKQHREEPGDAVFRHYEPINNVNTFLDIQLKFFFIRKSYEANNGSKGISDAINDWVRSVDPHMPSKYTLSLIRLNLLPSSDLAAYNKYYYDLKTYKEYVESWNNCSVDLIAWKRIKYLSIPDDFHFLSPGFVNKGGLIFPLNHMRKLFDEYVNELYDKKFRPRLMQQNLAELDKSVINRLYSNIGSDDDKRYFNLPDSQNASRNLSRCMSDNVSLADINIHSNQNLATYFALIKYHDALSVSPIKQQKDTTYAMWFKNVPNESSEKERYEDALKDVFDYINQYCPKAKWGDFKSIFSKNGVKTKIEWTGDASILNFIFRRLHSVLVFQGSKWHVLAHYFFKADKTGDSLSPDKLQGNSHYKNDHLENHLSLLLKTLSK